MFYFNEDNYKNDNIDNDNRVIIIIIEILKNHERQW